MSRAIPSTIRENKAARIKLSILQTTLDLIGKNSFEKIHVNQICEQVGISKVTFFKYFPQKEDILLYYHRVWCFHRCVDLFHDPKQGIDGIKFIFEKVSQTYERTPGMLLGLASYVGRLEMPTRPFPLKIVERQLLYPDIENISDINMLSLDQIFENFLLEAIFNKEITRTSDTKTLVQLLNTVFYGTILTAHIKQVEFPLILFRNNIEGLVESLRYGEASYV